MKRVLIFVLAYMLFSAASYAQWSLSIHVTNGIGEVLEGATVQLQGTSKKGITDANGESVLTNLRSGNYTLQVTYLGYQDFMENFAMNSDKKMDVKLQETSVVNEEIVIHGVRAANDQPATFTVLKKEDIDKQNFGQDVPYLLSMEPSVVTTSDAGTGIGYTSMRIRGLDSRKVNVTINGIPYNDPESHGTFWVDIPDIASSVRSIQLQRGLGKSAAGPAAFGASLNLETSKIPKERYFILDNSIGSYNTVRNTFEAGTGLLKGHWFAEGRFSRIGSNGYIDRATSSLRSYYGQAGYYSEKSIFRIITFGGYEETYQAWYGIDSSSIDYYNRKFNWAGYYTRNGQENFYDKQVDHYTQNHFQANYIHSFSTDLQFNAILNYTKGKGYYQEYYDNVPYSDYMIASNDTADLTGRKWLDNNLIAGNTFLSYNAGKINVTAGFGFSRYFKAKHFGEILWGETIGNSLNGFRFYQNEGNKTDVSPYVKMNYALGKRGNLYFDVNYRFVDYKANGIDRESGYEVPLDIHKTYNFLNPILGVSYTLPHAGMLYAVVGASHREPARSDFINNYGLPDSPKPEKMYNSEIGIKGSFPGLFYELNFYYMLYRDELIKTGQLDDVGAPIVKNAGKSYRTGVELNAGYNPVRFLILKGNVAISKNKTDFKDYFNNAWLILNNVDISYSPSVVAAGEITLAPVRNMEVSFINKYVGKQYLDNTQNETRILKDYLVSNLRFNTKFNFGLLKDLEFKFQVNNLFNVKYNSNGYMYGDTPYYYPQALRNYLIGLSLGF